MTTIKEHVAVQADLRRLTPRNRDSIIEQFDSFILNASIELAPKTVEDYGYKLRYFIRFCIETKTLKLTDITPDDIRRYIYQMQQNHSPKSVNDYYKVLRSFFSWLVNERRLKEHPMARIKAPKVPHVVIKILSAEHIGDILLLCEDGTWTGIRNKAMFLVLLDTGIRLAELAAIKVDDVDIRAGIITVMGKGAKQRVVGIGKNTVKAIKEYYSTSRGDHPQLWLTEEGRPLTYEGISSIFKTLKKRAGFKDIRFSPHTVRHTSGTMALINGAEQRDVQMLLGHSTPMMTQEYTKNYTSLNAVKRHRDFSPVDRYFRK